MLLRLINCRIIIIIYNLSYDTLSGGDFSVFSPLNNGHSNDVVNGSNDRLSLTTQFLLSSRPVRIPNWSNCRCVFVLAIRGCPLLYHHKLRQGRANIFYGGPVRCSTTTS